MIKLRKIGCSLFLFLIFTITASSQVNATNIAPKEDTKITKSVAGGSATTYELIGFWKMIPLPNPAMNKVNPWHQ